MSTQIADLVAKLRLNSSEITSGVTKAKSSLSELEKAVNSTGAVVRNALSNLNTKPDVVFSAMAKQAEDSFKRIRLSAVTTKDDILRAEYNKNAILRKLEEERAAHAVTQIAQIAKATHAFGFAARNAFTELRIVSDAEFNAMRKQAEDNYERIKKSAILTSNDILRAEKAKAEIIKKLNAEQYAHIPKVVVPNQTAMLNSASKTLGVMNLTQIAQMRADIMKAYNDIARSSLSSAQDVQRAAAAKQRALEALANSTNNTVTAMHRVSAASQQMSRNLKDATGKVYNTQKGVTTLQSGLLNLGSVIRGIIYIHLARQLMEITGQFFKTADSMKLMEARLSLVTRGFEDMKRVQISLFESSQRARSNLESTTSLYIKVARALKDTNYQQKDFMRLTETVNKAIRVSGATSGEAAAGVLQLGQALASGRLQGDEFRSIMENMPRLAEAIAVGMGKTVGELRALSREGALTTDVIVKALLSQAAVIDREFSVLPMTIGQAWTVFTNELKVATALMDKTFGIVDHLSSAMLKLGDAVRFTSEGFAGMVRSITALPGNAGIAEYDERVFDLMASIREMQETKSGSVSGFFWTDADEARLQKQIDLVHSYTQRVRDLQDAQEIAAADVEIWNNSHKKSTEVIKENQEEIDKLIQSWKMRALAAEEGERAALKQTLSDMKVEESERKLILAYYDAIEAKKELNGEGAKLIESLEQEAETLLMGATAAKIYAIQMSDISDKEKERAIALTLSNTQRKELYKSIEAGSEAMTQEDKERTSSMNSFIQSLKSEADALGKNRVELAKSYALQRGYTESTKEYKEAVAAATLLQAAADAKEAESKKNKKDQNLEYLKALEKEYEVLGLSTTATKLYEIEVSKLTETQKALARSLVVATAEKQAASDAAEEASEAIQKEDEARVQSAQALLKSLRDEAEALNKTRIELVKLNMEKEGYSASTPEYQEAVSLAGIIQADGYAKEADKLRKTETREWEHFLERVQDATADTLYDIFDRTIDGFDDLLDRMGDLLKRALAEWGAQALLQPVIVPIAQSLTGTTGLNGTTQGGGGINSNLLSQAGSYLWNNTGLGNTVSNLLGIGGGSSYFGGGVSALSSAASLYGAGGTTAASGYTLSNAFFETAPDLYSSFTLAANESTTALGTFSQALSKLSPYLMAYSLGSMGYGALADFTGLPEGEYSSYTSGAGAVGGMYLGAQIGSGYPIIGTIIGAIIGGLAGSIFGPSNEKHYLSLADYPNIDQEWSWGQQTPIGTVSQDYLNEQFSPIINNETDQMYVDMRYTVAQAVDQTVTGVYDWFEDWAGELPEELGAGILADLQQLDFSLDGESMRWVRNRGSERFEIGLENILEDVGDMMMDKITPIITQHISDYVGGVITDASGIFQKLSSNHAIFTAMTNSALFKDVAAGDYTKADSADLDAYLSGASELLETMAQFEAAWDAVTTAFDLAIKPLSQFGSAFKDLTTNIDGAITVLEQLGFNEEALTEARTKGLAVLQAYVDKESGDFAASMQSTLNKLTMSDISYSVLSAKQGKTDRDAQAYDMLKTSGSLLGMHGYANLMGLSQDIYDAETKDIAKNFMDSLNDSFMQATMEEDDYALEKAWTDMIGMKDSIRELFAAGLISGTEMMEALGKVDTIYNKTKEGIKEAEKAAEDFVDSMVSMRSEAMDWINAGLPVISQIESDLEYRASGVSREDFLRMKIDAFGSQYKAGDMTLADWENAMSTVSEWYMEATAASEEAAQRWEDAAEVAKDLADSIRDTKNSLLMGNLNVALPSVKYGEAVNIYQQKLFAAKSGGPEDVQDFLSFASDYLNAAQENYKSSEIYQQLFQSVMADMDALTAMVEAPDYTQKLYDESKKQTSILSSIDSGVADVALSLVASIKSILGEKQTSAGFDLTKIDSIMKEYGFTPSYQHSLEYGDWLRSGTATDSLTQELMSKHGFTSDKILADARTISAWYDYVTAQRRSGNAMSYAPLGFADGGISYGSQLAWVSEGQYPAEAHVPLPNGKSIPVDIRGGSTGEMSTAVLERIYQLLEKQASSPTPAVIDGGKLARFLDSYTQENARRNRYTEYRY